MMLRDEEDGGHWSAAGEPDDGAPPHEPDDGVPPDVPDDGVPPHEPDEDEGEMPPAGVPLYQTNWCGASSSFK